MRIIGIAGTNGSGKDTVGRILAQKYSFLNVSVSDLLRDECIRRGLPVERKNLRMISAQWRREGGLGVLVDKATTLFQIEGETYDGLAVGSLRNPGEAERVHQNGGIVVWVDADSKTRYERIQLGRVDRREEDDKTFEQFIAEEKAEMQPSGDAATLNMAGVKTICDYTLFNEGSEADLDTQIRHLFEQFSFSQ